MHALGLEFGSAAQLSKRPGSVWNCLCGIALKRSPGIIRKSRVSYPGPGFLSSATWPSLPKKHYYGLNQTKLYHNQQMSSLKTIIVKVLKPPTWGQWISKVQTHSEPIDCSTFHLYHLSTLMSIV